MMVFIPDERLHLGAEAEVWSGHGWGVGCFKAEEKQAMAPSKFGQEAWSPAND